MPLLLDFSAADGEWLGGLVWKAVFLLWIPQGLMLAYVLKSRAQKQRSRRAEVALLLAPLLLLGWAVSAYPVVLLLALYASVRWNLWLLAVLLPTVAGIVGAVATNRAVPLPPGPAAAATRRRLGRYALLGLAAVLLSGTLGSLLQRCHSQSHSLSTHDYPPYDDHGRRAAQARQDSLRFLQEWSDKTPPPRPW